MAAVKHAHNDESHARHEQKTGSHRASPCNAHNAPIFRPCERARIRTLEAISEVDVEAVTVPGQHDVARMPVAQPEDVADHAHDGQRARVVGAPVQPHLARLRVEPEDFCQILAGRSK